MELLKIFKNNMYRKKNNVNNINVVEKAFSYTLNELSFYFIKKTPHPPFRPQFAAFNFIKI